MWGLFTKKETKELLIEKILEYKLKQLNNIQHINRGGCAIVALALGEYLQREHSDVDFKIVYLFSIRDNAYDDHKVGIASSCGHAVLQIGDKYVDSNGFRDPLYVKTEMHLINDIDVEPNMVYESIQKHQWNPCFERATGVPEICEILSMSDEFKSKIRI